VLEARNIRRPLRLIPGIGRTPADEDGDRNKSAKGQRVCEHGAVALISTQHALVELHAVSLPVSASECIPATNSSVRTNSNLNYRSAG